MGKNAKFREQRLRLYRAQDGKCHWCHKEMIWLDKFPNKSRQIPDNACTTDHLDDRLDPNRGKFGGQIRRVAACKKCNEYRSNERCKNLPLWELHRRSGRFARDEMIRQLAAEIRIAAISR
jgi:hypothetical protein